MSESVRQETIRVTAVDQAVQDNAWRALVHASRDIPDRVGWLREMRSLLGLNPTATRAAGRCPCGAPLPLRISTTQARIRKGMCAECRREEP